MKIQNQKFHRNFILNFKTWSRRLRLVGFPENPTARNRKLKTRNYKLGFDCGFSLIETLVAISILMVAVASPLTIAQKGLSSAIYAKDQVIASYLAQDAIEYIRNVSDSNVADGNDWLQGIEGECGTACRVDTRGGNESIQSCGSSCPSLQYDSSSASRVYGYQSGWSDSAFTRSVTVEENVSDREALVTVAMSWSAKNVSRSITVNTKIFNWR